MGVPDMTLIRITDRVVYADRLTWGAVDSYPRLGGPEDPRGPYAFVPRRERTHAIHHHTVVLDSNDDTPNRWTTLNEVYDRMRQLQIMRPDLGKDVPYNDVAFWMEEGFGLAVLVICEGRGPDRWGAHTKGLDANGKHHNGTALALAFQGNTELPMRLEDLADDFSAYWSWTVNGHITGETFVSLGSLRPVRAESYGHRDFRDENDSSTWTLCPGEGLYNLLPNITLEVEDEESEDEMKSFLIQEQNSPFVFIMAGVWYSYLHRIGDAQAVGIDTTIIVVPDGTLESYVRADRF